MIQFDIFSYQSHIIMLFIFSGLMYGIFLYCKFPYLWFFLRVRVLTLCLFFLFVHQGLVCFFGTFLQGKNYLVKFFLEVCLVKKVYINYFKDILYNYKYFVDFSRMYVSLYINSVYSFFYDNNIKNKFVDQL